MAKVEDKSSTEPIEVKRNSLAGLQTGGRLSPCPLSIREFGYRSFIYLGQDDQRRIMKDQYEALFGNPDKKSK